MATRPASIIRWKAPAVLVAIAASSCQLSGGFVATGPSWFEPVKLSEPGGWSCMGLVDLDGDGTLELVLFQAGTMQVQHAIDSTGRVLASEVLPVYGDLEVGCASADFNGDGRPDLVVAGQKSGTVLLNQGGFRFTQMQLPTLPGSDLATTFIVAPIDADNDGFPDLYLARSVLNAAEIFLVDGCQVRADGDFFCGKVGTVYPGSPNILLHNLHGQGWEVVSGSGSEDVRQSQGVAVIDVDGDGLQDLVVANDAGVNRIYRSKGDLTFEDVSDRLGLTQTNHGMGVAAGDLNGDGLLDFAFSDIGQPLVVLGASTGFHQIGGDHGLGPSSAWAWGVAMEDFDNDGALDLLFEGNTLTPAGWFAQCRTCGMEQLPRAELVLYRNDGKANFVGETPAGLPYDDPPPTSLLLGGGTSLAVADVDGDGVLDGVILRANTAPAPQIEAWLLRGKLKKPAASLTVAAPAGARVTACVAGGSCQTREVVGIDSFRAFRPREVHFGLGAANAAEVTVEFPHGHVKKLGLVPAGRVAFTPG